MNAHRTKCSYSMMKNRVDRTKDTSETVDSAAREQSANKAHMTTTEKLPTRTIAYARHGL